MPADAGQTLAGFGESRNVQGMSVTDLLESLSEQVGDSGIRAGSATVTELQQAMSRRSLSAAEVTAFYTERIDRLNPDLHAVISVSPDAADQAAASDARRAAGTPPRPLEGIPVLVKDNIAVAGSPATAGSPALQNAESGDAFCVSRLRAAGAVILGKANLSEWANFRSGRANGGWSTLGGQAVNPHGAGRMPSGSSSGSAIAVAAGFAPLAVGSETDGSIVSPSGACGVVGVKPTVGLVSRCGIVPISAVQDTAGPMALCVADAAAMLGAMVGADPADQATAAAEGKPGDYTAFLDAEALAGARIGIWREPSAEAPAATTAVLDAAVGRLRSAGAELIDPVRLPGTEEIWRQELTALLFEFKHDLNAYLAALPGEHPMTLAELITFNIQNADRTFAYFGQDMFERAEATSGDLGDPAYLATRGEARRLAHTALDGALDGDRLDAVVALSGGPSRLIDHLLGDTFEFHTSGPAAVCGYPSLSVPAGQVAGLPVGLTFMGRPWTEPALLAFAYSFEVGETCPDDGPGQPIA
jgi:amidase